MLLGGVYSNAAVSRERARLIRVLSDARLFEGRLERSREHGRRCRIFFLRRLAVENVTDGAHDIMFKVRTDVCGCGRSQV